MKNNIRSLVKWLFAAALILLLCAAGLWFMTSRFLLVDGQLVSRNSRELDLRETPLSFQEYEQLQQKLPQCDITWNVPFQGGTYSSDSTSLRIESLSREDMSALAFFPHLASLDATACEDMDALQEYQARNPGCQIIYQITLGGQDIPWDTETLTADNVSLDELRQNIPYLPNLSRIHLTGKLPAAAELKAFQADLPGILVSWETNISARTYPSTATELDLSGVSLTAQELEAALPYFPVLERCDVTGCGIDDDQMIRICDAFYQTFFVWEMDILGQRFSTASAEIDISGKKVADVAAVENLLPYFPLLERLIMSDCGVGNETMDAFNRRHEDIQIIWSVYLRGYSIRTDSWYFYPYKMNPHRFPYKDWFYDIELEVLRYCTEMRSIDLGHMPSVSDISFCAYMPHLRYLILTETAVTDLTPLANCTELVYFEATKCRVSDLSPLINCVNLENVNLGWNGSAYPDTLAKMPWLQHIWWCSTKNTYGLPCSDAEPMLTEALPDTILFFDGAHPVDGGWRTLQTYYDMRDIMGMFYLR